MWARRCGVPPTWPSKLKVFLSSIFTGTVGFAIYTFMVSSNVGYLEFAQPSTQPVTCLDKWPYHAELSTWFDQHKWEEFFAYQQSGRDHMVQISSDCKVPAPEANRTCSFVSVPLHQLIEKLRAPIEFSERYQQTVDLFSVLGFRDWLQIYARLFLILSIVLWFAISCHDLALLHSTQKDYILDAIGLRNYFPCFKETVRYLIAWRVTRQLFHCRSLYLRVLTVFLAVLLTPVLFVWRLLVFMFIICPLAGVLFLCHPIRTSRLWAFLISITVVAYGVCLTVHMAYFYLVSPQHRPRYAVTWRAGQCTCGCSYPLSQATCMRLLMIGLVTSVKAGVIAFRTVKGLRRSSWANLLSVTFTVPLNAYAVEWTQPDGKPILNREAGDAVQSELAFDPFALMDEQPQSARSHVTLRPSMGVQCRASKSGRALCQQVTSRTLQGPRLPNLYSLEMEEHEQVGCCGFPYRTGGIIGRLTVSESSNGLSEEPACSPPEDPMPAGEREATPKFCPLSPTCGPSHAAKSSPRTPTDLAPTDQVEATSKLYPSSSSSNCERPLSLPRIGLPLHEVHRV